MLPWWNDKFIEFSRFIVWFIVYILLRIDQFFLRFIKIEFIIIFVKKTLIIILK